MEFKNNIYISMLKIHLICITLTWQTKMWTQLYEFERQFYNFRAQNSKYDAQIRIFFNLILEFCERGFWFCVHETIKKNFSWLLYGSVGKTTSTSAFFLSSVNFSAKRSHPESRAAPLQPGAAAERLGAAPRRLSWRTWCVPPQPDAPSASPWCSLPKRKCPNPLQERHTDENLSF